ncbi:MAG: carbohydrate kinase family protein [candidate division KSB1 bacterium]|nr:carbohydrate kinase family protein [candidate division KSB1 bacterium]MDZ7346182.1 carbohydrate kinase family protein [candidate division KSB1 bacterium]
MAQERCGIALVGSTIVDEILPIIDAGRMTYVDAQDFVPVEELAGEASELSVGGMALNVAVDLAKIAGGYPIVVVGKVGRDEKAQVIRRILAENGLSDALLAIDPIHETSSTEVLHIRLQDGVIERCFRHRLGAMGSFNEQDIPWESLSSFRIAMFGYGLLLPQLDLADKDYGCVLGRVLAKAQAMGLQTALDFVSPDVQNLFKFARYRPALKYVDILCINEDQAAALAEENDPAKACRLLVERFDAGTAVVHCGAVGPNYAFTRSEGLIVQPNFRVSAEEYQGNAGAGDAFSAGFLHGMHQGWTTARALEFAAAAAAVSLRHLSCTGAMRDEAYLLDYIEEHRSKR